VGALALAFEQLKQKLASQGVFDESVKKPLPYLPGKVAVITSPTGAAVRDFLKVIHRRFSNIEIVVVPVKVQGDEAANDIISALEAVNKTLDVDVIVVTRGGGSLEDLWAFNNEKLALAIRASRIPVVSAVGHEIDITISDLAADVRAPTPSAAAEMLVAEKDTLERQVGEMKNRLEKTMKNILTVWNERLDLISRSLRDPRTRVADWWLRLDDLQGRIIRSVHTGIGEKWQWLSGERRALMLHTPLNRIASCVQTLAFWRKTLFHMTVRAIEESRARVDLLEEKLKDLGPMSILKRGYSITRALPAMAVVKKAADVRVGDAVNILLAKGILECRVEKTFPETDTGPDESS
jgi:exodeoxyribonuclease VII large subunit